ncbi:alpha/beta hydrolase [Flavihumibacter sp. UBA7668]|uniref:alpha/beta hydrolase family protein n=1 Tax=Flavihumibacter sp. UBA7668 TaxID=1946542 RepID=UPI0025BEA373|nr:alpha/beta hydrolase [Flavihumibacter sp. UBA7668]
MPFRLLLTGILCYAALTHSQAQTKNNHRYKDIQYDKIQRTRNLSYYPQQMEGIKKKHHHFDWYASKEDTVLLRPLIIAMHGGGFKLGNKSSDSTPFWAREFAKRGYAVASINYRKSKKKPLSKFEDLAEGCYDALKDLQLAIDYFKANAAQYRIDPARILLAGNSAGGMMALHEVCTSEAEFASYLKKPDSKQADTTHNPNKILAAINMWGSIYDSSWISSCRVPIISIHGSSDRVVPSNNSAGPFFGTGIIVRQARRSGIPHYAHIYVNSGHELHKHFNPVLGGGFGARKRWRDMSQRICAYLYTQLSLGNLP